MFERDEVEQSVPDRFAKQLRAHAGRFAVWTRAESLTYAQLDAASDRVAAAILAAEGEELRPVVLLFGPGAAFVAACLGAWKAGRICVPLDPVLPRARVAAVLEDTRAGLVLTDGRTSIRAHELTGDAPRLIEIDRPWPTDGPLIAPPRPSADSVACIVYTSGSTGRPKGVMQTHRNLLHQTMIYTNDLRVATDDRLGFVASVGTLFSIWFCLAALLNGATVVPLEMRQAGVGELARDLVRQEITVLAGGLAFIRQLDALLAGTGRVFPAVRLVSFGGDALYRSDVEACRRYFPDALVGIGLGSTETGSMTRYWLDRDTTIPGHVVPVGYPAADKEVLLLGPDGREAEAGEAGEIVVRSRYLSPGYWRRPDLTAERFQADPGGGDRRLYRTGDLGRFDTDGCLAHLGRVDFQVKIRTYRVEIGEVEGALLSVPGVRTAVVVARDDPGSDRRLVAYVVPTERPGPTVSRLRQAVAAALPEYMVPTAFVTMDALPQTAALKVDRLALPDPGRERPTLDTPFLAPRTPIERTLAGIWAEVLDLDTIGVHDRFLDLGGNSLLALRIASRVLETFRAPISERALFDAPTVEAMALEVLEHLVDAADEPGRAQLRAELGGAG